MLFFSTDFRTRNFSAVPGHVLAAFLLILVLQIVWASLRMSPTAEVSDLPEPPATSYLRFSGLGDEIFLSKVLTLWLQAHDYQPGISLSFHEMDYDRLIGWLDTVLSLDAKAQYPLLLASRVYAEVNDAKRQRKMLAFIKRKFEELPDERWRWMAHAVYVAKHRLRDQELALGFARSLSRNVSQDTVPFWARQMHIYILEDMGRIEAAKILLGGLIESGEIEDPNEIRFLMKRLRDLDKRDRQ